MWVQGGIGLHRQSQGGYTIGNQLVFSLFLPGLVVVQEVAYTPSLLLAGFLLLHASVQVLLQFLANSLLSILNFAPGLW